jgi:phosphoribosylaminoimidazole-succinocarboxamide synthase
MAHTDTIRKAIDYTMPQCILPELGAGKKGKVREIYFVQDKVVMLTNDRVSAFDFVLDNRIPFKGMVLNQISEWAMKQTEDVCPNALVASPDPNVVVQKQMKNTMVECIVRGYLWGSMAAAYEKKERSFCGLTIPDGLMRFQKLEEPLFTPTTKAEVGHDENLTLQEVEDKLPGRSQELKELSLKLYARGVERMRERGLILLDTKYEFGFDENGVLHVIDEVNTPDSSRLCDVEEYDKKFPLIEAEMKTGKYSSVGELLKDKPDLKIKEYSKQYVRDVLLEKGFKPESATEAPKLTEDVVVECASRYIQVCERITGQFVFPELKLTPQERVVQNLTAAGLIQGCCALIFAGSDSDAAHIDKLKTELKKYGIPARARICSAHKQPAKLQQVLEMYNQSAEPCLIVACAGGTDALSGTASFHSVWPVVSCPPDGWNETCLRNPPGSSNAFVLKPANLSRFVAQHFTCVVPSIKSRLAEEVQAKVRKLEKADEEM